MLNRSLSNAIKMELIASRLRASSHEVEVISQGEVVELQFKFYPAFSEAERFHSDIPVHYASALPIRRLNGCMVQPTNTSVVQISTSCGPI